MNLKSILSYIKEKENTIIINENNPYLFAGAGKRNKSIKDIKVASGKKQVISL